MTPEQFQALLEILRGLLTLLQTGRLPDAPGPAPKQTASVQGDAARAVLAVLARAEKPLKGRAVASRAGLSYTSHLRQTLSDMVRGGAIAHVARRGYWPADKPVPPSADLED